MGRTRGKGSTEKGSAGGKERREERVKGCGRKYAGGKTPSKLNRILGGK